MNTTKNSITGIILSGGRSCRMGSDKGLCMLVDRPMVSYGLAVLSSLCDEVLISANDNNYDIFNYPIIKDEHREIGPLGGIYSAIKRAKNEHILVLSCDMPFINQALFQYILANRDKHLAAIPQIGGFVEPTCGYYHKNILKIIEGQIQQKKYKLTDMLEKANYKKVKINNLLPFYKVHLFANINNPKDLEIATQIILQDGE